MNLPEDEQLEKAYSFLGEEAAGRQPLRPKKGSYEHITDAEINRYYKEACRRLHPDKHVRGDKATQDKFKAKMQQLQVYMELIKSNREELRKKKAFKDLGFSEEDVDRALKMDSGETQEHAEALPAENLRGEIAYLADFHCAQLEEIAEHEASDKEQSCCRFAGC